MSGIPQVGEAEWFPRYTGSLVKAYSRPRPLCLLEAFWGWWQENKSGIEKESSKQRWQFEGTKCEGSQRRVEISGKGKSLPPRRMSWGGVSVAFGGISFHQWQNGAQRGGGLPKDVQHFARWTLDPEPKNPDPSPGTSFGLSQGQWANGPEAGRSRVVTRVDGNSAQGWQRH